MPRLALIDGDLLLWLGAYYNKDRHDDAAMLQYLDTVITEILLATKADQYSGFIQGKNKSHRHELYKDYKANRPFKPEWFLENQLRLHDGLRKWQFQFAEYEETDDAIASAVEVCRYEPETTTIVCSSDKDFNQLETEIYNTRNKTTTYVTPEDAQFNLCCQILSGDSIDNIKGLPGIGIIKAARLLRRSDTLDTTSFYQRALRAYIEAYKSDAEGLLEFAHNTIKITLKRDAKFVFKRVKVPDHIKLINSPIIDAHDVL